MLRRVESHDPHRLVFRESVFSHVAFHALLAVLVMSILRYGLDVGALQDTSVVVGVFVLYGLLVASFVRLSTYSFDKRTGFLTILSKGLWRDSAARRIPLRGIRKVQLREDAGDKGSKATQVVLVLESGEELKLSGLEYMITGTGHEDAAAEISDYLGADPSRGGQVSREVGKTRDASEDTSKRRVLAGTADDDALNLLPHAQRVVVRAGWLLFRAAIVVLTLLAFAFAVIRLSDDVSPGWLFIGLVMTILPACTAAALFSAAAYSRLLWRLAWRHVEQQFRSRPATMTGEDDEEPIVVGRVRTQVSLALPLSGRPVAAMQLELRANPVWGHRFSRFSMRWQEAENFLLQTAHGETIPVNLHQGRFLGPLPWYRTLEREQNEPLLARILSAGVVPHGVETARLDAREVGLAEGDVAAVLPSTGTNPLRVVLLRRANGRRPTSARS